MPVEKEQPRLQVSAKVNRPGAGMQLLKPPARDLMSARAALKVASPGGIGTRKAKRCDEAVTN